jgi:micrococcal nuclease
LKPLFPKRPSVQKAAICLFTVFLSLFSFPEGALCQQTCEAVELIRVVDGDTIAVRINGDIQLVRYIGIDSPEMDWENEKHQFMAEESLSANLELVSEGSICLQYDEQKYDDYDRLLAYVYVDGVQINRLLLQKGLAEVMPIYPNTKYSFEYLSAQRQAYKEGLGIWSAVSSPILFSEAEKYAGEYRILEGVLVKGYYIKNFSGFILYGENNFQVRIPSWAVDHFNLKSIDQFLNQKLRLTGLIQISQGKPYMIINDLDLIQIMTANP